MLDNPLKYDGVSDELYNRVLEAAGVGNLIHCEILIHEPDGRRLVDIAGSKLALSMPKIQVTATIPNLYLSISIEIEDDEIIKALEKLIARILEERMRELL